ncbi:MAG: hypothetical protein ACOX6Q_01220 [Candidatus Dojkabacteria bacterium]
MLVTFSFFVVKITNRINIGTKATEIKVISTEECTSCGGVKSKVVEEKILPEENGMKVTILPASETVDITEVVLGSSSIVGRGTAWSCKRGYSVANRLESDTLLCSDGTGTIDYKDGTVVGGDVIVDKDAEIQLVEVTYPLGYWLGQDGFENSTKTITSRDPSYNSSGEVLDEAAQSRALAPKEAETFRKNIDGTVRQQFMVKGSLIAYPKITELLESGEYIIKNADHDPKTFCAPEVAVSDFNGGKSNYVASDNEDGLYWRQQIPGGDKYDIEPEDGCLDVGNLRTEMNYGLETACWKIVARIKGVFEDSFSRAEWNACHGIKCEEGDEDCEDVGPTGDCTGPVNIMIEMSSIFGDPYECEAEGCATAAMTYLHKATLSPQQASKKKVISSNSEDSLMHFVATPCKAIVVETRLEIGVWCLWDDSPTMLRFFQSKTDSAPGQDFPSNFDKYWRVTQEAIKRSSKYYKL